MKQVHYLWYVLFVVIVIAFVLTGWIYLTAEAAFTTIETTVTGTIDVHTYNETGEVASSVSVIDQGFHDRGDVNWDGCINILDSILIGNAFGSSPGKANWNPECDLNHDNRVNILDTIIFGGNNGRIAPYYTTPFRIAVKAGKLILNNTYNRQSQTKQFTIVAGTTTIIEFNFIRNCSDGTPYSSCSITKPLYCDNGNLINKCTQCGCSTDQNCNVTNEECYTPTEIKTEYILNYLNESFYYHLGSDVFALAWDVDSYDILTADPPDRNRVIEFFNSRQNQTDGTWFSRTNHYAPITAEILMLYNRSGVKPATSLDNFFSRIDTWAKVKSEVKIYDVGNYWGGLWGHVEAYIVYKHQAPPWTSEFLNELNTNFSDWSSDSHQRTHVVMNLYALNISVPRVDDVVIITLSQQQTDGSWQKEEPETVFNIGMLGMLKSQTTVDKTLIDSAIAKGNEYVKQCYKTTVVNGKTYGYFTLNTTSTYSDGRATALGVLALINPTSDVWTRWFAPAYINKTEVDNSLEYLRWNVSLGVHDMAEYVISKNYLGTQIPNKQQIIDYFDNNQNQTDGSWKDTWTPMFTTHRVLLAYYILNATPKHNLDSFFSNYDTWIKAKNYIINETMTDYRDIYHITLGWSLYHVLSGWRSGYPPWLDTYFSEVEKEPYLTSWTTGTDAHRRTHILYNYVIARRQFPNLDGIINETLREQLPDGHWDHPRPIYGNAIQLVLLQQIIKLYPNHRTSEIQNSIDKSRIWVYNSYNTTTVNGVVMGHFGNSTYIEDAIMTGIMSAGINGLMDINIDMTFSDIMKKIQPLNLAKLPMTGIGEDYLLYQTNYTGAWETLLSTRVDKWKFNTVRLAFRFSDIPDGKTHSVLDYAKLDNVLTVLDRHGLKAILDLHNYQDMEGYFGSDTWINNWVAVANRYKNDGRVFGYELFNEPNNGTWNSKVTSKTKVTEAFANCTDAIRQIDPNKPVIWASPYYWVEDILNVTPIPSKDKRANVYYAVHPWNYVNSTEEAQVWSNGFVSNITHWNNVYDHSLWMGEFGVENSYNYDAQKYTADTIINWSVQNNVGFCWWLYSVNHWVQGSADDVIYNSNYILHTSSHSYIMDLPVYPEDTVPKQLQGHPEVVFGWFPWTHGITYDQDGEFLRYHISVTTSWASYTFLIKGVTYSGSFDVTSAVYQNGVVTYNSSDKKMIIDFHNPHNVTIISTTTGSYINFIATYRGAPLWYSKSLNPTDMLIVPESNGRFGGYDGPVKIEGKFFNGSRTLNFNGYGDWEHVWFLGGGWSAPKRLWIIFNDDKYYGAVAELKYTNGTIAWHVGRFGEVGGPSYVFDDYQWIDNGTAMPLYVELKGPIRDAQGNVKGVIDLKTDPQKARTISSIWMLYENISGTVLSDTFINGTAWAEIRK